MKTTDMPDRGQKQSISVPAIYKDLFTEQTYAVKVSNEEPMPWLPDAKNLLINPDCELSAGDIVCTVYHSKPSVYHICRLGIGVMPRRLWGVKGDFSAGAMFIDYENQDDMHAVDLASVKEMHKIVCWRDGAGEFHALETAD